MHYKENILNNTFLHILTLTIVSVVVVFYQFPAVPQKLAFDEVEFANLALSLQGKPYTPYSPLATGHSTLYFYILLSSFEMFGITSFALRLPSAFFGIVNPIIMYAIFSLIFLCEKKKTKESPLLPMLPLLLAIILIGSRWYFNFARFAFEATFLLFLELVSLYSFLRFRKSKRLIWIGISGLFAGLAFNSYTPGRIFFLVPIALLVFDIVRNRIDKQESILRFSLFLIPFLVSAFPLLLYLSSNTDIRLEQLSFIDNPSISISDKTSYFLLNIQKTIKMFFVEGDLNGRHNYPGKPAINLFLGVLMAIGFIKATINWSKFRNVLFIFFFFISLLPSFFTLPSENPHMLRTYTAIPSIVYFVGLALIQIFLNLKVTSIKNYATVLISVCILLSCIYELRTYFYYQTQVFNEAFEIDLPLVKALDKYKSL